MTEASASFSPVSSSGARIEALNQSPMRFDLGDGDRLPVLCTVTALPILNQASCMDLERNSSLNSCSGARRRDVAISNN